jgi:hypothetical protein
MKSQRLVREKGRSLLTDLCVGYSCTTCLCFDLRTNGERNQFPKGFLSTTPYFDCPVLSDSFVLKLLQFLNLQLKLIHPLRQLEHLSFALVHNHHLTNPSHSPRTSSSTALQLRTGIPFSELGSGTFRTLSS